MTTFDDREKGYERKFVHDQELEFRAYAKRNRMLGLWAAQKLGKQGPEAEQYAQTIALASLEGKGHEGVVEKLLKDFSGSSIVVAAKEIHKEMERLLPLARQHVQGDA